jgi:hypothetical protein
MWEFPHSDPGTETVYSEIVLVDFLSNLGKCRDDRKEWSAILREAKAKLKGP